MRKVLTIALSLLLTACALPETSVKTGSARPHLAIKGAPADAALIVDGLEMGAASQYDGNPKVLIVEEGVHLVEIRRGGEAIHVEKAFFSNGETKIVNVHAGGR